MLLCRDVEERVRLDRQLWKSRQAIQQKQSAVEQARKAAVNKALVGAAALRKYVADRNEAQRQHAPLPEYPKITTEDHPLYEVQLAWALETQERSLPASSGVHRYLAEMPLQ